MLVAAVDAVARETTLFAAIWFLVGGIDDLLVDLVFLGRALAARLRAAPAGLPARRLSGPVAVFIPAWDESAVIAAMLRATLNRYGRRHFRLYVGAYPNDRATIDAVARVAERSRRVRLVIGAAPGPTTKADCLNALWRALRRDEAGGRARACAVLLHDAEDLVHPEELDLFARHLPRHVAVQLPVLPLRRRGSPLVSGHYCDEFAEAHGKQLPVRQALGAGLPLAGVGCAIRRDMIDAIAQARGGDPFDAGSLTEDYELGLTIAAMGGRTLFARERSSDGAGPIAVRAYFPDSFAAAVRQKARWMTGIALAGWDRTGWSAPGELGDHWMRMRDRRATLAMPVLAVAYLALVVWGGAFAVHALGRVAPPALPPAMRLLLGINLALLGWRLAMRSAFVARAYGWREACWVPARMIVANVIALAAARRALAAYLRMLAGAVPKWDKTAHHFPDGAETA